MISAATTLAVLRGDDSHRLLCLHHKCELLKSLRIELEDFSRSTCSIESIILAINTLFLESGNVMPITDNNPFNPPLALERLGMVDIYGRLKHERKHGKAIYDIIMMQGGLHKLQVPYAASSISW